MSCFDGYENWLAMLSVVRDVLSYLRRDDRRVWFILLGVRLTSGISRSMFLVAVNATVLAMSEDRLVLGFVLLPVTLMLLAVGSDVLGTIYGRAVELRLVNRMRA